MALPKKTAPVATGVNFGSLDMYVAGGGLPEGDYIWADLDVRMHQATDRVTGSNKGAARLGVMITLLDLNNPVEETMRTQFYSFGTGADKSFAPNAAGTGIVPVPGGPATTFPNSTNWAIMLKSLYDCSLPEGIFTNDVTALKGMHVHMANVPEPEERKGFQSKAATGEAAVEERRAGTIAVVTEIKDDGKPWEGTGGVPEAKPAVKANGKVSTMPKKTAAPAPAEAIEDDDDIAAAAINGITEVLTAKPDGCPKLALKIGTLQAVKKAQGEDMASAVIDAYFGDDASLNGLLGQLGYVVAGPAVKLL